MAVLPSSLIFAVILAVWAAYLMQHWVRRRDHIATARSVDRFSEAMRVLERRQHRPHLDLSEPVALSYALSPVRPASPDVMVKRAVPGPARQMVNQPGVGGAARAVAPGAPEPTTGRGPARARGVALLVAAAVMVAGTALGMVGVLPWWTAAVGIGAFVGSLLVVRRTVRRSAAPDTDSRPLATRPKRRATKSAARPAARSRRSAAAAGGGAAAALAASAPREGDLEVAGDAGCDSGGAHGTDNREIAVVAHARTSEVYDVERAVQVGADAPQVPVNAAQRSQSSRVSAPAAGTWQPVPVPPPTYTLKAKAVTFTLPDELPTDGTALSLEEEFEDLPVAIRDLA